MASHVLGGFGANTRGGGRSWESLNRFLVGSFSKCPFREVPNFSPSIYTNTLHDAHVFPTNSLLGCLQMCAALAGFTLAKRLPNNVQKFVHPWLELHPKLVLGYGQNLVSLKGKRPSILFAVLCLVSMQLLGFLCFIKAFVQVLAYRIQDSQRCFYVNILTQCCQKERS